MRPQDLHLLPVFAAVARHGSFTEAARELRLTKSVVSKHVRTLEERCGARLIDRTTRRLRVTHVGERVLTAAAAVVDAAGDVDRIATSHREGPSGTLRVTAPLGLGTILVAPVAAEIARLYPAVSLELDLDDRPRDLVAEGFDVALRMSPMRDSAHIVRRLGWDEEIIVGAPELVQSHRAIGHPSALRGAPWVVHSSVGVGNRINFHSPEGKEAQVSVAPRAVGTTADSVAALARGGVGFALLPRHFVVADLAKKTLERACPAWYCRRLPLHALLPGRKNAPLVTLFLQGITAAVTKLGFQTSPME